jgi:hypothetical protein
LAVFTEDLADGPYFSAAAPVTPKAHHSAGRSRDQHRALADEPEEKDGIEIAEEHKATSRTASPGSGWRAYRHADEPSSELRSLPVDVTQRRAEARSRLR